MAHYFPNNLPEFDVDEELHEIVQSLDGGGGFGDVQQQAAGGSRAAGCWGGLLVGDSSGCMALSGNTTAHFKHKLCALCQERGICVPAARVRAIRPDEHELFMNCANSQAWTERTCNGSLVAFRTINQTAKCRGERLVIFRSAQLPAGIAWAPMPDSLVQNGEIRLKLCKGTLVPAFPPACSSARGVNAAARFMLAHPSYRTAGGGHKRSRAEESGRSTSDSSSPTAPSPPAASALTVGGSAPCIAWPLDEHAAGAACGDWESDRTTSTDQIAQLKPFSFARTPASVVAAGAAAADLPPPQGVPTIHDRGRAPPPLPPISRADLAQIVATQRLLDQQISSALLAAADHNLGRSQQISSALLATADHNLGRSQQISSALLVAAEPTAGGAIGSISSDVGGSGVEGGGDDDSGDGGDGGDGGGCGGDGGGGPGLWARQQRSLEQLQGVLRRSMASLRGFSPLPAWSAAEDDVAPPLLPASPTAHTPELVSVVPTAAAEEAATGVVGQLPSWLPLDWLTSHPPSPPATSSSRAASARGGGQHGERGRGSKRGGGGGAVGGGGLNRGRWSSGLCHCLREPQSCLCVLLCWPVLTAQLGQKIVRSSWLCFCFGAPMLLFALLYQLPFVCKLLFQVPQQVAVAAVNATSYREFQLHMWGKLSSRLSKDLFTTLSDLSDPMIHLGSERAAEMDQAAAMDAALEHRNHTVMIGVKITAVGFGIGVLTLWSFLLRTLVRRRDTIPGSPLRDLCVSLFCWSCGMCQLARHEYGTYRPRALLSSTGDKDFKIGMLHPV